MDKCFRFHLIYYNSVSPLKIVITIFYKNCSDYQYSPLEDEKLNRKG